jgi:glycosyltransferase involved in cell wall biosynthesis
VHALNSPDLTGVVAYLISKITNIPYIFEIQDLTPELFCDTMGVPVNGTIFSFLRAIEGVVVPNSAKTIFVSEATRDYTVSRYKLESSKCIVIYNSLNKSFIRRFFCNEEQLKSNKKHRLLQSRFKVVYLGSLEAKIRGLDDLVMSIKFLVKSQGFKDITLVFVGDGDMKNELIEFVRRLGLSQNVIFTGALPRNEAWKWLQIADVAVVPHKKSLATEFTIPTKLFEYMAAGKVIIASNLRGLREVIKDGYNGLLFAPNDSADLARKILEAKANLNRQELAGHAKNDFDEKYYGEKGEEKIRQLYKELLK